MANFLFFEVSGQWEGSPLSSEIQPVEIHPPDSVGSLEAGCLDVDWVGRLK